MKHSDDFDEMMNKDIITLNTNRIQSHHITIKKGILMKREITSDRLCGISPMMYFSFRWCFDERMMNVYTAMVQLFNILNHQFIVFTHRLTLCE
mgnify:FL=1